VFQLKSYGALRTTGCRRTVDQPYDLQHADIVHCFCVQRDDARQRLRVRRRRDADARAAASVPIALGPICSVDTIML